ncbi:hypothetical protein BH11GEM1_BH11GEM1_16070 [soil metagenome]
MLRRFLIACGLIALVSNNSLAETGSELWLRYRPAADAALRAEYRSALRVIRVDGDSPTLRAAREELTLGLTRLLGAPVAMATGVAGPGVVLVAYVIRPAIVSGRRVLVVAANDDIGALYGVFALLRQLQTATPVAKLAMSSRPHVQRRMLDHWDNLDRSVERGYAGQSLWEWDSLPAVLSPRYRDYARANASIGINGSVLTNVNANAKVLTAPYLAKVAATASLRLQPGHPCRSRAPGLR